MTRTEIINRLIKKYNYKKYLEIGAPYQPKKELRNFDNINIEYKFCIDPNPEFENKTNICDGQCPVDFIGTSDDYFSSIDKSVKFDIIFIDGLHHHEQVLKDISNSLVHLNENGIIVCHDCLPNDEDCQMVPRTNQEWWTGDVWKALAKLRLEATELEIRVVNTDWGCGLIRKGKNIPYKSNNQENIFKYSYFVYHKQELMNIISIQTFTQEYL